VNLGEGIASLGNSRVDETIEPAMTDTVTTAEAPKTTEPSSSDAPLFVSVCERVKAAGAASVFVFRQISELGQFVPQWETLAKVAADANVFYEPWMLLPALGSYHSNRDFRFALVFGPDPETPSGPAVLYGFFPFERRSRYRGIPCSVLKLIKHKYMELCTPLIRRDLIAECVAVLLDWTESASCDARLVEFRFLAGEDRATQELHAQLYQRRTPTFQSECSARALFRPAADAETFLSFALAGKRRKEFRRLEKRLAESGRLEYRELAPTEDPAPWVESFLRLEAKGWKGEQGSAMALHDDRRGYFQQISTYAHQLGRLMMLGLFLDDRPIALKCNFFAGCGSWAFKIAFDEEFARSSPGVLLEIENIRRLHEIRGLSWMDSCAIPKHFMINRLWPDRRTIDTFVVSTGKVPADFLIAMLPFVRWVKRSLNSVFSKSRKNESDQSDPKGIKQ
jgi:CelD/BcsL family acetyltransferase involved in cellulose biosynthesis